jgi:FkbM family methyltransferase
MIYAKTISIYGKDARIYGYEGDPYFDDVQAHSANNPMLFKVLAELPPHAVLVDGGANLGTTAVSMCRGTAAGARVIAVEPSPNACLCLERTIAANNLAGSVTLVPAALSDQITTLPFMESKYLAGSHVLDSGDKRAPTGHIETVTLDALAQKLALNRIDLVKLDIEGYELDALKGAAAVIRDFAPIFVIEINSFTICAYRRSSPVFLLEFILEQFGNFTYLHDGEPRVVSTQAQVFDFMYRNMAFSIVDDIRFGGH